MLVSEFSIWVTSAQKRYHSCKELLEVKDDPESEPYRSKYAARNILSCLEKEIELNWGKNENLQITLLQCLFMYHMGVIDYETDEISSGCDLLTNSWEEMKDIALKPECCILGVSALNQLGIIWSGRGELGKALDYLLEAEKIYNKYKETEEMIPYTFESLFSMTASEDGPNSLETAFTYTNYYLAQVYDHRDENEKAAKYCWRTLKRQKDIKDFDVLDYASNCASLSQFYEQEKMFQQSKHLLCCSASVLNKYESTLPEETAENEDVWEQFKKAKANISCYWIKYGESLLCESKSADLEKEECTFLRLLDDDDIVKMEKEVPSFISSYEDAKVIFLLGQKHVGIAKSYCKINEYANKYTDLTLSHNYLYKYLASYDPDTSRQCKMHKRRIDMLEDVLSQLNPRFYLLRTRQIMLEIGSICHDMVNLKLKTGNSAENGLSTAAAKKINSLIHRGLKHFMNFLEGLKDKDGKLPEVYSDDLVRGALISHFYIGFLYSKYIEMDTKKQLHNLSQTEEHYSYVSRYVAANPLQEHHIEKETLEVLNEMLELLPQKKMQITGSVLF